MKKSLGLCSVFLLLQLLLPVCTGLGLLMDRPFQLLSEPLLFLLLVAVSVFLTIKLHSENRTRLAVSALFFAIVNSITIFLTTDWWGGGLTAVTVIICGWVVFHRSPGGIIKILCLILCILPTVSLLLLVPLWMFATAIGETTVVHQLDSPDGRYTARLIDSNDGALGGDTLVKVQDNRQTVNIGIGSFVKEYILYSGEWGEFQGMTLTWEDADTLLINGRAYEADALALVSSHNACDALGITLSHPRILEYSDSHGGFHGDGTTVLKISGKAAIPDSRFWHPLPMTETVLQGLSLFELGDRLPEITNGSWFFLDRHSKSTDPADYTKAFSHGSYNFTFAVYDSDARMLYYFKVDT